MKIGYVSINGKPNVGNSTLINNILDRKVSIATFKPQMVLTSVSTTVYFTRNELVEIFKLVQLLKK